MGGSASDMLDGGAGNDSLTGAGRPDTLSGGTGNDTFVGGTGADVIDGGSGTHGGLFGQQRGRDGLSRRVTEGAGGEATGDIVSNVERVIAPPLPTSCGRGRSGNADRGLGNDTLIGGAGADVLDGGTGIGTASYAIYHQRGGGEPCHQFGRQRAMPMAIR